ncbi:excalibur calcium-binding domain-containing protein [Nonomuraea typhae]|uniref:excalibur calcium-binding domain-containing protein n=1 Tax=Nonomuraea typhae TaxID=2603600 RepID=UPI001CA49284|nr:excalibur calcium-binding domain-containing protein [Nonomuraea typhae]
MTAEPYKALADDYHTLLGELADHTWRAGILPEAMHTRPHQGAVAVDLGAGAGIGGQLLATALPQLTRIGVDRSPAMLAKAGDAYDHTLLASIDVLLLHDESADLMLSEVETAREPSLEGQVRPSASVLATDRLFYVWSGKGVFVNRNLVRYGYGKAVLFEPNDLYIKVMRAEQKKAQQEKLRIWSGACDDQPSNDGDDDKPGPTPTPTPSPGNPTDPRFETCEQANNAGYGPYYKGKDPECAWYEDRDGDGVVCEH